MQKSNDARIRAVERLPTPHSLKEKYPLTDGALRTVATTRRAIGRILHGADSRLLVVVGPCSIHDPKRVFWYAKGLAKLAVRLKDQLLIVLRFCGDKPRTGKAWTGYWSDPHMDGSCDFAAGWMESRKLAAEILDLGLPLGCEFLDAAHYQNIDDAISHAWLGARDVGSQSMRKLASGLSVPVGFKNNNVAGVRLALDAMSVARESNTFVSSNDMGQLCSFTSMGNRLAHLIHRGTDAGPNYDPESISDSVHQLQDRGFLARIVIDASHGNSRKDHRKQAGVIEDVVGQVMAGSHYIAGIMYESYLKEGSQSIPEDLKTLIPGVSVTDGCDSWETTERVLREVHSRLSGRPR